MKTLLWFGAIGVALAAMTAAATVHYRFDPSPLAAVPDATVAAGAADRLAGAIRFRTVSPEEPGGFNGDAFVELHGYLRKAFPLAHASLVRETVAEYSLLYAWRGTDPSLKPILLVGHMDVVPVEAGSEDTWVEHPFSGRIAEGYVWGRGAIDNKSTVVGALEAVEMLLAEGFQPARTIYLAYGHDEEVGGLQGAARMASLLKSRGVELEMVLDEGGVIGNGLLPGVSAPVALVGVAEKGFVTLELLTRLDGGHSSLPPPQSAVGILSAAVSKLERSQMRARLEGPTRELFDRVGPKFGAVQRAMFANLWLTRPFVVRALENSPATNAMVRTTTAVTMFEAGTKDNVLPSTARAVVNFRILPGDSIAKVLEHVLRVIDDERVEIRIAGRFSSEPSEVSGTQSEAFRKVERAVRSVSPDVLVAPYLVMVVTDSRHYSELSRNIFRFLPLALGSGDLFRIHGTDERIGISEYEVAVRIYRQLFLESGGK